MVRWAIAAQAAPTGAVRSTVPLTAGTWTSTVTTATYTAAAAKRAALRYVALETRRQFHLHYRKKFSRVRNKNIQSY